MCVCVCTTAAAALTRRSVACERLCVYFTFLAFFNHKESTQPSDRRKQTRGTKNNCFTCREDVKNIREGISGSVWVCHSSTDTAESCMAGAFVCKRARVCCECCMSTWYWVSSDRSRFLFDGPGLLYSWKASIFTFRKAYRMRIRRLTTPQFPVGNNYRTRRTAVPMVFQFLASHQTHTKHHNTTTTTVHTHTRTRHDQSHDQIGTTVCLAQTNAYIVMIGYDDLRGIICCTIRLSLPAWLKPIRTEYDMISYVRCFMYKVSLFASRAPLSRYLTRTVMRPSESGKSRNAARTLGPVSYFSTWYIP